MLTYPMEERGSLPLYEYLCRRIRADILSGALPAGTRLPSKRALAEHLRVSVVTVEGAYSQLEAEGYLQARPKRGFFVSAVEQAPPPAVRSVLMPETTTVSWRLDLGRNQVDTARFPVSTWARLTRQVLSEAPEALLSPVPHQGLAALRQAIADDLRDFKGMAVSPEQIVIGAGAEYLYLLLAQLLGRDTVFAVEDPGYPKIRQVYDACGAACVPIPLDNQGVELAALMRSKARALHISPNHQYPTGLVTPIARRQALLRWAEDTGSTIIEDDYDSEFRYTGRPIPTLQSIDDRGRVIYLNTFSQTISPSMRLGFLVLPPRLLERLQAEFDCACCDDAGAAEVIRRLWQEQHYLCDPHTAVAWSAAEQVRLEDGAPVVVLSTASPYKFPAAVLGALEGGCDGDEFAMMERLHRLTGTEVPRNLAGLQGRTVRHRDVIDKEQMLDYVLAEVMRS